MGVGWYTNTPPSILLLVSILEPKRESAGALLLVFLGFGFWCFSWVLVWGLRREAEGGGDGRQLGILGGEGCLQLGDLRLGGLQLCAKRIGRLVLLSI